LAPGTAAAAGASAPPAVLVHPPALSQEQRDLARLFKDLFGESDDQLETLARGIQSVEVSRSAVKQAMEDARDLALRRIAPDAKRATRAHKLCAFVAKKSLEDSAIFYRRYFIPGNPIRNYLNIDTLLNAISASSKVKIIRAPYQAVNSDLNRALERTNAFCANLLLVMSLEPERITRFNLERLLQKEGLEHFLSLLRYIVVESHRLSTRIPLVMGDRISSSTGKSARGNRVEQRPKMEDQLPALRAYLLSRCLPRDASQIEADLATDIVRMLIKQYSFAFQLKSASHDVFPLLTVACKMLNLSHGPNAYESGLSAQVRNNPLTKQDLLPESIKRQDRLNADLTAYRARREAITTWWRHWHVATAENSSHGVDINLKENIEALYGLHRSVHTRHKASTALVRKALIDAAKMRKNKAYLRSKRIGDRDRITLAQIETWRLETQSALQAEAAQLLEESRDAKKRLRSLQKRDEEDEVVQARKLRLSDYIPEIPRDDEESQGDMELETDQGPSGSTGWPALRTRVPDVDKSKHPKSYPHR